MTTLEQLQEAHKQSIMRAFDPFFEKADELVAEFFAANPDAPMQYVHCGNVVFEIENPRTTDTGPQFGNEGGTAG